MHGDFRKVELRAVGKLFGPVRALAGIDLRIGAGEGCLLVGPNGAGKSTLLRILSTLLRPTAGEVLFDDRGAEEAGAALRGRIAYVSHQTQLRGDLTGRECLRLALDLGGAPAADAGASIGAWVERLAMTAFLDRPVRTYSRGQAQRVALGRALLSRPRLLLLDEPTTGLDAAGIETLRAVIDEERERGTTVVASTHDAAVLADLLPRRVEMRDGGIAGDTAPPAGEAASEETTP